MKAFELFSLHESFQRMMDSQAFTPSQKVAIGHEMILSLPPRPFCSSTPETYTSIQEAMVSCLEKLDAALKPAPEQATDQPEEVTLPRTKKSRK